MYALTQNESLLDAITWHDWHYLEKQHPIMNAIFYSPLIFEEACCQYWHAAYIQETHGLINASAY